MLLATRCCFSTMIAFATACGARTELPVADSGGTGGGGGSGGEGGAPTPSCVLTQLPGEIVLAGGEAVPQRAPSLERYIDPDDGIPSASATLVQLVANDDGTGSLTFEWVHLEEVWPPAVDFAPPLAGVPACKRYVRDAHQALLADGEGTPVYANILQPDMAFPVAVGEATPQFFRDGQLLDPLSGKRLGGFTIAADSQLYLIDINNQGQVDFRLDWGCGSTPVRAAAIARSDASHLVALTSGADFGGCGIPGGASPSTRLQIARFTGLEGELLYEVDLRRSVQALALAPRGAGAWLAVREDGAGADTTLDVYRLDEKGAPLGEPTRIDPHNGSGAFSISEMGDKLVASYRDEITNHTTIQIVEGDGTLGASAVLTSADNGESSVLGKDESVYLAYTTDATPSQVHVARFDCVAP